ncbi:MAG: glycosyltransferase family 1 protein [Kiritimatiellia bacterium]
MKVCIDIQSAVTQRAGVGRYTSQLVRHLAPLCANDSLSLFYFDFKRKGAPLNAAFARHTSVRWCPGRLASALWKTLNWPTFQRFAGKADVYHFPNFVLPPLASDKSAAIATIHDMSFMRLPLFAEERNEQYLRRKIRRTVRRSDAIITISEFSSREIQQFLQVDPRRVEVIYPGVDSRHFTAPPENTILRALKEMGISKPYILTVGTLEPRKNIPFLIELFEKTSRFDGTLVIAGAPGWKWTGIADRIKRSPKAQSIKWISRVEDSRLPALYAGAELFVFPSFYEGFGFPPLEAMSCSTPVVSSTGGSLAEVLDNGALLVDKYDTDEWLSAIDRALTDSDLRASLVKRGHEVVKRYSWRKTAERTWNLYRRLHEASSSVVRSP